jgi:predicted nucleic acid-binding protein
MRIVLDSSVILSGLLEDEQAALALQMFEKLQFSEIQGVIPLLCMTETANGLLMAYRRNRMDKKTLYHAIHVLEEMPFEVIDMPNVTKTTMLAEKHQLTFYDAVYVQIAIQEAISLATLDKALGQAARLEKIYYS